MNDGPDLCVTRSRVGHDDDDDQSAPNLNTNEAQRPAAGSGSLVWFGAAAAAAQLETVSGCCWLAALAEMIDESGMINRTKMTTVGRS